MIRVRVRVGVRVKGGVSRTEHIHKYIVLTPKMIYLTDISLLYKER